MNKFLKLLLIALVAALLPGCGSEKTTKTVTTSTADGQTTVTTTTTVKTDLEGFDALVSAKKTMVVTLGASAIPSLQAINPGASAHSGLEAKSTITFVLSGESLTGLGAWTLNNNTTPRFQVVGSDAGTAVAQGNSLTGSALDKFKVAYDATVGAITVTSPINYGIAESANLAANVLNQAKRTFVFTIESAKATSDTVQSGAGFLTYTADDKPETKISVPFTFTIGS